MSAPNPPTDGLTGPSPENPDLDLEILDASIEGHVTAFVEAKDATKRVSSRSDDGFSVEVGLTYTRQIPRKPSTDGSFLLPDLESAPEPSQFSARAKVLFYLPISEEPVLMMEANPIAPQGNRAVQSVIKTGIEKDFFTELMDGIRGFDSIPIIREGMSSLLELIALSAAGDDMSDESAKIMELMNRFAAFTSQPGLTAPLIYTDRVDVFGNDMYTLETRKLTGDNNPPAPMSRGYVAPVAITADGGLRRVYEKGATVLPISNSTDTNADSELKDIIALLAS